MKNWTRFAGTYSTYYKKLYLKGVNLIYKIEKKWRLAQLWNTFRFSCKELNVVKKYFTFHEFTMVMAIQHCERSRPGLRKLGCWHDRQRTPLQDGDHSGNDARLVPGFLRQRSGMFPERFRRMSVPVSSREIRLTGTEHPRCGTLPAAFLG